MILRDALKYAVLYLGYDDVIDISNKDVTEKTNKDVRTLVRCANLTYTELICEYLPIYKKEKIRFTNGYFPFSELEDSIANIYSLKKGVENVKYSADATFGDTCSTHPLKEEIIKKRSLLLFAKVALTVIFSLVLLRGEIRIN